MRKDTKKGNLPEIGDFWKDPKRGKVWMLMKISFVEQKNTDMVFCKSFDADSLEEDFSFMYIKRYWEFLS